MIKKLCLATFILYIIVYILLGFNSHNLNNSTMNKETDDSFILVSKNLTEEDSIKKTKETPEHMKEENIDKEVSKHNQELIRLNQKLLELQDEIWSVKQNLTSQSMQSIEVEEAIPTMILQDDNIVFKTIKDNETGKVKTFIVTESYVKEENRLENLMKEYDEINKKITSFKNTSS